MDKTKVANDLVRLHSDYQHLAESYGMSVKDEYSEAVAKAILLLSQAEEEGAE